MAISRKMREQMRELCGSISNDDGLNARDFHQKNLEQKEDKLKQLRLCQQVARTLMLVLPECTIGEIQELVVDAVVPGSRSAAITVRLRVPSAKSTVECDDLLEVLKQQEGWLRSEIAQAITRKKVPRLAFEFSSEYFVDGRQESENE